MKTVKATYIAPQMEVIELEIQNIIAVSNGGIADPDVDESTPQSGKDFWGN